MEEYLLKDESELTDDLLFYIENEARALADSDEFSIENSMDRKIFSPAIQRELGLEDVSKSIANVASLETLSLNHLEAEREQFLPEWVAPKFKQLKKKIKVVFCKVVRSIEEGDAKTLIKAVLLALIPAFATGVPAAALPIIIGLVALLLKYGIDKVCPI